MTYVKSFPVSNLSETPTEMGRLGKSLLWGGGGIKEVELGHTNENVPWSTASI